MLSPDGPWFWVLYLLAGAAFATLNDMAYHSRHSHAIDPAQRAAYATAETRLAIRILGALLWPVGVVRVLASSARPLAGLAWLLLVQVPHAKLALRVSWIRGPKWLRQP